MKDTNNPLHIFCKSCGAPLGFDIIKQTYRCESCGSLTDIAGVNSYFLEWRRLHQESLGANPESGKYEEHSCPGCGAVFAFKKDEASVTCVYCGSRLIRKSLVEKSQVPDIIIPFYITAAEAKERFLEWADARKNSEETACLRNSIDKIQCYYLPYRLFRGPASSVIYRDETDRRYHVRGFIEGVAVNTTEQLDNTILNEMEPFDWSEIKPFSPFYVAGHPVQMCNLSGDKIIDRMKREIEFDFTPLCARIMHSQKITLRVRDFDVESVSALLPVYFIKAGRLTAVMNGQTGRIAVSTGRTVYDYVYYLRYIDRNPLPFTITAGVAGAVSGITAATTTGVLSTVSSAVFYMVITLLTIITVAICTVSYRGFNLKDGKKQIILKTESARVSREDGGLIREFQNILKNPFNNTPVFIEKDGNDSYPVEIRFITAGRVLGFLSVCALFFLLPLILFGGVLTACGISMEQNLSILFFLIMVTLFWTPVSVYFVILYFIQVFLIDVYERPLIYRINEDGTREFIKQKNKTGLSLFRIFSRESMARVNKGFGSMIILLLIFSLGIAVKHLIS